MSLEILTSLGFRELKSAAAVAQKSGLNKGLRVFVKEGAGPSNEMTGIAGRNANKNIVYKYIDSKGDVVKEFVKHVFKGDVAFQKSKPNERTPYYFYHYTDYPIYQTYNVQQRSGNSFDHCLISVDPKTNEIVSKYHSITTHIGSGEKHISISEFDAKYNSGDVVYLTNERCKTESRGTDVTNSKSIKIPASEVQLPKFNSLKEAKNTDYFS